MPGRHCVFLRPLIVVWLGVGPWCGECWLLMYVRYGYGARCEKRRAVRRRGGASVDGPRAESRLELELELEPCSNSNLELEPCSNSSVDI